MKKLFQKSLVLVSVPFLMQCAHKTNTSQRKSNPLMDRLLAMEIQMKEQSSEINRLKSALGQLKNNPTAPRSEPTLGSLLKGQESIKENKVIPTTKLKPESAAEEALISSPLMAEGEPIVDSSQDSIQTYYRGLQLLNENKYGIHINLSELQNEVLQELNDFIQYVNTQEKSI